MKLLVGLGNPGRQYVGTRHNVGYETLDRLARRIGWTSRDDEFDRLARSRFDGLCMDGLVPLASGGSEKLLLLKPTTFMNLSGKSVAQAIGFHQLQLTEVMVVLDDLALPIGRMRIRSEGSSGGHNGLKDIERILGSSAYPRLRLGIDPPPVNIPGKDYVLGRWTPQQMELLDPVIDRACDAILLWMASGIEPAMSRFNAAI